MTLWKRQTTVEEINERMRAHPTMMTFLGVECISLTSDSLTFRMPVTEKVKQPQNLLHGGASAALAESVGSLASFLTLEGEQVCVGTDLNISHLRAVHEGSIRATATPLRVGSKLQVWEIRIVNDQGDLTAISRLTTLILNKRLEKK